ncbi:biotin--protein ligase [Planococcus citri]|uniref:biotin--protein ligase n=1 Tax=Planococcus citri TaxID=170843 RepID=UPI0031F93185
MLLTFYYLTSTCIQSWRINSLKKTFVNIFNKNASIVLYKERELLEGEYAGCDSLGSYIRGATSEYCSNKKDAHVLDLWSYKYGKRGCSVFPAQSVNITNWINIPSKSTFFPIRLQSEKISLSSHTIWILLEASFLQNEISESKVICELENYGIPKAWTAKDYFALVMETDIEHLVKFGSSFMTNELCLNNLMEIIRLETVSVYGTPCSLLHSDRIPILIYSLNSSNTKSKQEKNTDDVDLKTFHIEMLRKIAKNAEELQQSSDTYKDLDYPPITITKIDHSKTELRKSKNKSGVCDRTDSKNSKQGISRSCSEDTSASLAVQTGSTICSLSATSQYSTDTVIIEDPMDTAVFNSVDDLTESLDWRTNSHSSLHTSAASSIAGSCRRLSTPVSHRGEQKTGKPPTILLFSESPSSVGNIKNTLKTILQKHKYTIYSLPLNDMLKSLWIEQAYLVVLCGNVPLSLKPLLLKYLLNNGGRLLCLCSDLLGVFLPTFKTAEVRPDEVVSFSYGQWNHITLLHHIFCYQPSPKSSKFSMDESPSNNTAFANTPSTVELRDTNSKPHTLQVKVLAAEETWQTPTLLLATSTEGGGKALFSQVHLEVDPRPDSDVKYNSSMRLSLLTDLLSNYLDLECTSSQDTLKYTPAYFLGRHEKKLEFLKTIAAHLKPENTLAMKNITLKFCGKGASSLEANERFLPVKLYDCPQNFSTVEYFENLKTEQIGRLVIYSEIMTSSLDILTGPTLDHGFVAVSRQQTQGIGRGGNAWISPDGCAMFSLQLHIPLKSTLGQKLSLLQHIVGLSVVSAVCSEPGYENLDLALKWPNDIYAGNNAKIGGLMVVTSISNDIAVCNIGCGVNLNNNMPTTCINEMITEMSKSTNKKIPTLSAEKYFAIVFNKLESLLDTIEKKNLDIVFDLYYKYWLHNLSEVKIVKPNGNMQTATIIGLDDYGFLKVRGEKGDIFSVHPDGNSFDMLQGLIAPK